MSPRALKKAFEASMKEERLPKAVIVVSLYGQSADMDPIKEICDSYNVPIIEDSAEALGATYKGKSSGTIGRFGVYSFNGNKIITTSGGGMLVSKDKKSLEKIRFWATQSRDSARHYQHTELGFNYRMSNILAGLGRGQLRVLTDRLAKKKGIYETYKQEFSDIEDIELMPVCSYGEPNYWLSVMTIRKNSCVKPMDVMVALENENIESRPVWKPMHLQPYFEKYRFYSHCDNCISIAEDIFNRGVCLPSDTNMTDEDINRVVKLVRKVFLENAVIISA
jgi:dTDP-4-amino-4,6-dideoxygalactose transaminase